LAFRDALKLGKKKEEFGQEKRKYQPTGNQKSSTRPPLAKKVKDSAGQEPSACPGKKAH